MRLIAHKTRLNPDYTQGVPVQRPTFSTATPEQIAEALTIVEQKSVKRGICATCQQPFTQLRYWQRFCSTKCRSRANNALIAAERVKVITELVEESQRLRKRIKSLETLIKENGLEAPPNN